MDGVGSVLSVDLDRAASAVAECLADALVETDQMRSARANVLLRRHSERTRTADLVAHIGNLGPRRFLSYTTQSRRQS